MPGAGNDDPEQLLSEPVLPITGRCLCGAVRFELVAAPLSAGYCHCSRCQRRTGTAASAQARLPEGGLRIVAGKEHVRTWQPEQGFAKLFCDTCGSALFSHDPAKRHWAVRLGALDPGARDPAQLPAAGRVGLRVGADP
ncbi:MAG TPA: GFA family protein [Solirubrobacteraceae bacterium]|nr:GFA family protein [Solirubrobacteraceae bacterium]